VTRHDESASRHKLRDSGQFSLDTATLTDLS
jgi:hypothetical protein